MAAPGGAATLLGSSRAAGYTSWNSADKDAALTLSGSSLIVTHTGGSAAGGNLRSIKSNASGKWYFEITYNTFISDPDDFSWGVATSGQSVSTSTVGSHASSWGCVHAHTTTAINKRNNSANTALTSTGTWASGNIFMCAVDIGAGKLWFGRGGTWFDAGAGAGDPAAGTNPTFTSVTGTLFIMAGTIRQNDVFTLNAGASAFNTAAPSGFSGWTS